MLQNIFISLAPLLLGYPLYAIPGNAKPMRNVVALHRLDREIRCPRGRPPTV